MRDFFGPGRSAVYAERAMATTSHPAASLLALDILDRGGTAVDAAIAASALLCVVEPAMTGIGGDCFALVSSAGGWPCALNGSGHAPAAASAERLRGARMYAIPDDSPHAVTVPGTVDAWCQLHADHGRLDLAALLEPAAVAAEEGYLVQPRVAFDWRNHAARLARHPETARLFLPGGNPPKVGDRHAQPALAATLRRIGRLGRAGFYEGPVAEDIAATLRSLGGVMNAEDMAARHCTYEQPVSASFQGRDIIECPPNGQGAIALLILSVLDDLPEWTAARSDPVRRIHLFSEATKHAYAARNAWIAEPSEMPVGVAQLLSAGYRDRVRAEIRPDRACAGPVLPRPLNSDTVYLSVVDRDGMIVSFINSLFLGFGSTILAARSGVLLHCRGMAFRLEEGHPNAIGPNRRPTHTIIPGMVGEGGEITMAFGVMGGQYQAAGHAHLLSALIGDGLDLQSAIDLPRHFAYENSLSLEPALYQGVGSELVALGHKIERASVPIGGAQAIRIDRERGLLIGGSDPRRDGCALGV